MRRLLFRAVAAVDAASHRLPWPLTVPQYHLCLLMERLSSPGDWVEIEASDEVTS